MGKYQAIISYTTHHLENTHSVLRDAVERLHEGRDAGQYAAVERLVAMEDGALVLRPRRLANRRGKIGLVVAAMCVIRAQSHDLPVRRVELAVRRGATSVYDYGDRPVHVFHCLGEIRVRELVFVSLAQNKKAENQT